MEERIGIIMNGVTGRMGLNQHLIRSILRIREEGRSDCRTGERCYPIRFCWGVMDRNFKRSVEDLEGYDGVQISMRCLADEKGFDLLRFRSDRSARKEYPACGRKGQSMCIAKSLCLLPQRVPFVWPKLLTQQVCATALCRTSCFFLGFVSSGD